MHIETSDEPFVSKIQIYILLHIIFCVCRNAAIKDIRFVWFFFCFSFSIARSIRRKVCETMGMGIVCIQVVCSMFFQKQKLHSEELVNEIQSIRDNNKRREKRQFVFEIHMKNISKWMNERSKTKDSFLIRNERVNNATVMLWSHSSVCVREKMAFFAFYKLHFKTQFL